MNQTHHAKPYVATKPPAIIGQTMTDKKRNMTASRHFRDSVSMGRMIPVTS
jgi:hypothetical protein